MSDPIDPIDPLERSGHSEIHRRIAEALAELVPDDSTMPPHPYLRRHLAEHAARGRVLDDAHVPPALLPWESSLGVRRLLAAHPTDATGSQWLQAWARLEPFVRDVDPLSRATSLRLARHTTRTAPAGAPEPQAFDRSPVTPVWSEGAAPDNVWLVNEVAVTALAAVDAPHDRALVMAGDDRGFLHALRHDGSNAYAPLRVHRGQITQLLALPGGLVATGSSDGSVTVVDALRGRLKLRAVPRRPGTWVSSLTLHRPAHHTPALLAAFSDGYVAALHPVVLRPVDIPLPRLMDSPLLSPLPMPGGGQGLLCAQRDSVHLYDGRRTRLVSEHRARVRAVAALPRPGRYAVADEDGNLSVHDATRSGDTIDRAPGSGSAITSLLLTRVDDGWALLTAGGDGSARLWSLPGLEPVGRPLPAHTAALNALTCPSGAAGPRLITAGADATVRSWPLTARTFHDAPERRDRITASALSPTQPHLLATARGGRIAVGDIHRSTDLRTVHEGQAVTALAWPRLKGRLHLAVALEDSRIILLDPAKPHGEPVLELPGHHLPALTMVPLNGVELLASGSTDGRVCVWDLPSGRRLAHFPDHRFSVRCLATQYRRRHGFRVASGGSDGNVRVWDVRTLQQCGPTIRCGQHFVNDLAFALGPDDESLVASAGQNGTLKLWRADTGEQTAQLSPGDGELTAVTSLTLPSGRRLFAAAGRTSIHLWDPDADRRLLQIVTAEPVGTLKTARDHTREGALLLLATGERETSVFRLDHDRI
ncbi:WD40 repeat domain-containing protein [Streptomyces sp. NPDC014748]|uniref:WD40 repeat domain-containing protein n=1 Tax=Streptomyces sp. NPDC014748 TaxID=3364905 RepID=UPI0036F7BE35